MRRGACAGLAFGGGFGVVLGAVRAGVVLGGGGAGGGGAGGGGAGIVSSVTASGSGGGVTSNVTGHNDHTACIAIEATSATTSAGRTRQRDPACFAV